MTAIDCVGQATRTTVLDVLRAVAWADGRLTEQERAYLRGAALAFGVVDMDRMRVEERPRLQDIGVEGLGRTERRIIYACAAWVALSDDVQSRPESLVLRRVREQLGLDGTDAHRLEEAAHATRLRFLDDPRRWREVTALVVGVARDSQGRTSAPWPAGPMRRGSGRARQSTKTVQRDVHVSPTVTDTRRAGAGTA